MQKQICNLKICKSRYVEVDMYLEEMYNKKPPPDISDGG